MAFFIAAGLLNAVADQSELMRLLLAIGILVLALRLAWRRLRDPFRW